MWTRGDLVRSSCTTCYHCVSSCFIGCWKVVVPDDQDQDWSDTGLKDTEKGTADGKTGVGSACSVAHEDDTPEHDVGAEVEGETSDPLSKPLSWELCCKETWV